MDKIEKIRQEPIKVYRVENETEQKGLWRKFDGTWEPLFDMLTDGQCRNMPMDDNDIYHAEGLRWFASAPSTKTLQKWFSKKDLEELTAAGFTITEFTISRYKVLSEFEYIFPRECIIATRHLSVRDIYPDTLQEPEAIPTFDSIWGWYSYIIEQSKKDPGYSERNSKLLADSFLELASRQEPLNLPPFILDKIDDALKNLQESIQRKIQEPSLSSDVDEAAEEYAEEHSFHPCDYDVTPYDCFKAGAEWMKNKMLEGAVEGVVCYGSKGAYVESDFLGTYDTEVYGESGDKVRIVVLKIEEE